MNIYPERTKTVVADLGEGPGFQSYFEAKLRREGPRRIIFEKSHPLSWGLDKERGRRRGGGTCLRFKGLNTPLHCSHKT